MPSSSSATTTTTLSVTKLYLGLSPLPPPSSSLTPSSVPHQIPETSNMDLNLSTTNSQQSKHGLKTFIFPQCQTPITTKSKEIII